MGKAPRKMKVVKKVAKTPLPGEEFRFFRLEASEAELERGGLWRNC